MNPFEVICELIMTQAYHQPALVSGFKVFSYFQNSNDVSFIGKAVIKTRKGTHVMVHIGSRISVEGYFFLIQNWWQDRHFIEVSAEYMHHCGAIITSVNKTITMRRDDLIHAETSVEH